MGPVKELTGIQFIAATALGVVAVYLFIVLFLSF